MAYAKLGSQESCYAPPPPVERPGSSLHQVDVCISLVIHGKIIAALSVKGPPHCSTHSARVRQVRLRIRRCNSLEQST